MMACLQLNVKLRSSLKIVAILMLILKLQAIIPDNPYTGSLELDNNSISLNLSAWPPYAGHDVDNSPIGVIIESTAGGGYFFPYLGTQKYWDGSNGFALGLAAKPAAGVNDVYDFYLCVCIGNLKVDTNQSSWGIQETDRTQVSLKQIKGRHSQSSDVQARIMLTAPYAFPVWTAISIGQPVVSSITASFTFEHKQTSNLLQIMVDEDYKAANDQDSITVLWNRTEQNLYYNNSNNSALLLTLNDYGNLAISLVKNDTIGYNPISDRILWQSFDSPGDTLLLSQRLYHNMSLKSQLYDLSLTANGLHFSALSLANKTNSSTYWLLPSPDIRSEISTSVGRFVNSLPLDFAHASLTRDISIGKTSFNIFSDEAETIANLSCFIYYKSSESEAVQFVRLEDDSRLHFYAFNVTSSTAQNSNSSLFEPFQPLDSLRCIFNGHQRYLLSEQEVIGDPCYQPLACGPLRLCHSSTSSCSCPFSKSNTCDLSYNPSSCADPDKPSAYMFTVDNSTTIFQLSGDTFTNSTNMTAQDCENSCLRDCLCTHATYNRNQSWCFLFRSVNVSLIDLTNRSTNRSVSTDSDGSNAQQNRFYYNLNYTTFVKMLKPKPLPIAAIVGSTVSFVFLVALVIALFAYKHGYFTPQNRRLLKRKLSNIRECSCCQDSCANSHINAGDRRQAELSMVLPSLPTKLSYKQMQKATKGFSRLLGSGGMGSVYLGVLPDGRQAAVKKLNVRHSSNQAMADQMSREFIAEVTAMGKTSHLNIVQLLGFCLEKDNQILVYEYLNKGSLDSWLFKTDAVNNASDVNQITLSSSVVYKFLDWPQRFKIASGIARGLAYLHEGCTQPILHLDIKPENILLDDYFEPKLADFGLAKLMARNVSQVVTVVRGTPGYIAPEMFWSIGFVSRKCDIYSLGVVLLELVGGRRAVDLQHLLATAAATAGSSDKSVTLLSQQNINSTTSSYELQNIDRKEGMWASTSCSSANSEAATSNSQSKAAAVDVHSAKDKFEDIKIAEEWWHLPSYAAKKCEEGRKLELVDKRLKGVFDEDEASRMIDVAIWCVQEKPYSRPSAGTVLQWLEGSNIPLDAPPVASATAFQTRVKTTISEYLQVPPT